MKRQLDQASAIMIAIEHCGDILPGQKCSAIFIDNDGIEKEKAFIERFCSGNGMTDPQIIQGMAASQVPEHPYWLVSFKSVAGMSANIRFHRVDDRTQKVI